jgi:predicted permease
MNITPTGGLLNILYLKHLWLSAGGNTCAIPAQTMRLLTDLLKDLRYAVRQLRRTPGIAIVVALSLALGIGANTAIFSAIEAVVLRPLPVKNPQELFMLRWSSRSYPSRFLQSLEGSGGRSVGPDGAVINESRSFSYSAFEYIREHADVSSTTFGIAGNNLSLNVGLSGRAESANATGVSGNFFEGMGVPAFMGRTILPEDDQEGVPSIAVVSFAFWQTKLGGDPSIIGKTMIANGRPVTIVGVTPRSFHGLQPGTISDLWIPLHQYSAKEAELGNTNNGVPFLKDPKTWWIQIGSRLNPSAESAARAQLNGLFQQSLGLAANEVPDDALPKLDVFSLSHGLDNLRSQFSSSLFLLMSVVGLVLLIACGNVAGLLLARASARHREIAVRLSLGANRSRLIRQLLTESVLLAMIGGAAGLVVAAWGDSVLLSLLSSGRSPLSVEFSVNFPVLLFTITISIMSGILFGLAPAIRATRLEPVAGLKQGAGSSSKATFTSGKILVTAQIALCVMIVTGSGLFLRTLQKLHVVDIGFSRDHLLLFTVRPGLNGYKDERLSGYYRELQHRLQALPGVQAASFASRPPIGGGTGRSGGFIEGYTEPDKPIEFFRHQIGPDYFKALGVPIVLGRAIGEQDVKNGAKVAVINEKLVDTYFHGDNPLGHVINFGSAKAPNSFEIVGVAKDVKYSQIRNEAPPTVYFSYQQFLSIPNGMTFEVRTAGNSSAIVEPIRKEALALDRTVPLIDVKSQSEVIDQAIFLERTIASLTSAFGTLALLLACVGLYGTMSYTIARRTREIGIRMALGAKREDILVGVLRETMVVLFAGVAIGLPLTFAATRMVADQLYGLTAHDVPTTLVAVIAISGVTFIAGFIPARRASDVSPIVALRTE